MKQTKAQSNVLVLTALCILMITVLPICTIDKVSLAPQFSTDEVLRPLPEERASIQSLDERPLRIDSALVYDSESDRVILFGGAIVFMQGNYDDTWSYDYNTNTWTNMSPPTSPPGSEWHQIAYHSGADSVVLFGGHVSGDGDDWLNHNQTWVYDYNTNTWTNMNPALAPPAMCGGTMDYDSESGLVILFGGGGWPDEWATDPLAETWTYNLTSNTWTNVTTGVHPSSRILSQMTYDSESDLMVFFGGFEDISPWGAMQDTWTYDTNTNTWTEVFTDGPNLVGDLVYNSESDSVVFFGGSEDVSEFPEVLRSETWTYDTNTETWEMRARCVKPDPRSRGELAYDSESDRVILLNGLNWREILHDCWAYDLNNKVWNNVNWDWQEVTPTHSPEATRDPAMAYDVESDLVVMFGGDSDDLFAATGGWYGYNETWSFDYNTKTWTNMSPSAAPPLRTMTEMVYDVESDIIILFGGYTWYWDAEYHYYNDTWAYDVNTNTWMDMAPAVAPNARRGHSMTYDSKSDCIFLFGGVNSSYSRQNDLWKYDYNSNTWTKMSPEESPDHRESSALVYDEESEVSVLFGGSGGGDELLGIKRDTWAYNSTSDTWTEMTPLYSPLRWTGMSAAYDFSADRIIVVYGRVGMLSLLDETWSYDYNTNTWFEMNTPNCPPHSIMNGLAFDSESNRTILFGGYDMYSLTNETWAYNYQINPPPPPGNFEVSVSGYDLVLTWEAPMTHPETQIISYNVYRGTSSGTYTLLAELGDALTFTDISVTRGVRHYYVVTAETSVGEGNYSNEVSGIVEVFEPFDDDTWTFIAYGDTRDNAEAAVSSLHEIIVGQYLEHDPEMIVHTGDLVREGGEAYQWPLFDESISAIYDWDPDMKLYSAAGNHERYTFEGTPPDPDYSNYLDYVDFSDVVDESVGETELYYSFDRQGMHFIFLNTVEEWDFEENSYTCPTAQMDWLLYDFATNDLEFIIVTFHYPMYSIMPDNPDWWAQAASLRETFHQLFIENGVDIVFNGHAHHYYRTERDGILYVVTGGGGEPIANIQIEGTDYQEGDAAYSGNHYCVCSINTETNQLDVFVYLIDQTIIDEYHLDLPEYVTTPTTPVDPLLPIALAGGAAAVIVVLVLIIETKIGRTNRGANLSTLSYFIRKRSSAGR